MNKETPAERIARLKRLVDLPDSAIDFSDIPEITKEELARMKIHHGGYRPGAGRKASGHIQVGLSLSPKARDALRRRAKREKKTMSAVVEEFLLKR